jgi:clan AA aspartic protease
MGEVIVKVKLTNYADELRARDGHLPKAQIRSLEADAIVDTGAVQLVLPAAIAVSLGLERLSTQVAQYADGRQEEVDVTDVVTVEILGRKVKEEALVLGDEILIGQTVLEKTDLHVDCRAQRIFPNPDHPNQPVMKIR